MVQYANTLTTTPQDKTTSFFNNYYTSSFDVSSEVDDSYISFFEKVVSTKENARLLAGSIMATAAAQGLDPMSVLQQFTSLPQGQLNEYLILFLNQNRIGTSYLGISNQPMVNQYIQRCILP